MASKKEILKNITNYTPEEIADAVRSGVVSMYELGKDTEGAFTPLLRKRVKELLEQEIVTIEHNTTEETSEVDNTIIPNCQSQIETLSSEIETTNTLEDNMSNSQAEEQSHVTNTTSKPGMFRNPFSFTGRIRRTEYGLSIIICFFINLLMEVMMSAATESNAAALLVLYLIYSYLIVGFYGRKEQNDAMTEGTQDGIKLSRFTDSGCFLLKEKQE